MDEEANKKSEEARRISREYEKGDYDSDRGWRLVQVGQGELEKSIDFVGAFFNEALPLGTLSR